LVVEKREARRRGTVQPPSIILPANEEVVEMANLLWFLQKEGGKSLKKKNMITNLRKKAYERISFSTPSTEGKKSYGNARGGGENGVVGRKGKGVRREGRQF